MTLEIQVLACDRHKY